MLMNIKSSNYKPVETIPKGSKVAIETQLEKAIPEMVKI